MCSLNINGWEMMVSIGFLAAAGYIITLALVISLFIYVDFPQF
jgi:hypothetical protein